MSAGTPSLSERAHYSIDAGDHAGLERLLVAGLDPDARDAHSGMTLLQHAVAYEAVRVTQMYEALDDALTRLLMQHGASPLAIGQDGEHAWTWARRMGHRLALVAFSRWAHERGLDEPAPSLHEQAHDAVEHDDHAGLERILRAGVDPDARSDYGGMTLLQHAVDAEMSAVTQANEPLDDALTRLLLDHGASPLAIGHKGEHAWTWARRVGHDLALEAFSRWAAERGLDEPEWPPQRPAAPPAPAPTDLELDTVMAALSAHLGRRPVLEELMIESVVVGGVVMHSFTTGNMWAVLHDSELVYCGPLKRSAR